MDALYFGTAAAFSNSVFFNENSRQIIVACIFMLANES